MWDVALIIDADVLVDPRQAVRSVEVAYEQGVFTVGFTDRWNIGPRGTKKVMDGWVGNWKPHSRQVAMESVSSCVAVRRDLWDRVGGFDEQFIGWGWEDVAAVIHFQAASARPLTRIGGTLWHLHHLVSSGNNREEPTFQANRARGALYKANRWNPKALDDLRRTPVPA